MESIELKALVDRKNNRVILVESEEDFVDVLFSFLTMPLGKIIYLACHTDPAVEQGCLNNLYKSVISLDRRLLRKGVSKSVLIGPPNGAATHWIDLKLKIDGLGDRLFCFGCGDRNCLATENMPFSHYIGTICACGNPMNHAMIVIHDELKNAGSDPQEGGVFVRGMSRFVTSDELRVCPPSTTASFPFFSKFGVEDASSVEEMTFKVGLPEVLNLLKNSLISKTPLTDTLLEKPKEIPELSDESLDQESSLDKLLCMTDSLLGFFFQTLNLMKSSLIPKKALKEVPEKKMPESGLNVFGEEISLKRDIGELASKITGKIPIRLMLCKSKRIVCYAEAGKDFVDLLFSFLALPLGYIAKEARGTPSKGCINHLYESVEDLDVEKYFKSHYHKEILLTPKIAPGFVYENQLLEVEEARAVDHYYYLGGYKIHAGIHSGSVDNAVTVESRSSSGGFVIKPALFTITDDLVVTPISTISCVSAMNKLEIPFSDIEERIVYMGKDEASRLMVASFTSEAALTETFIRKCTSEAAPTENSIVN